MSKIQFANLIQNYVYFYHLDKFLVLPTWPETVSDNFGVNYSGQTSLARSAPVQVYQGSGPRTLSISLKLHRDLMNDINRNVSNISTNVVNFKSTDYIDTLIKYVTAAAYPVYGDISSKSVDPPMLAFRFGNEIFIKGVPTSVSVTYSGPILSNNKYACADVTINVTEVDPYDANLTKQMGSFRWITTTFRDGIYDDSRSNAAPNVSNKGSITSSKDAKEIENSGSPVVTAVKEIELKKSTSTTTNKNMVMVDGANILNNMSGVAPLSKDNKLAYVYETVKVPETKLPRVVVHQDYKINSYNDEPDLATKGLEFTIHTGSDSQHIKVDDKDHVWY